MRNGILLGTLAFLGVLAQVTSAFAISIGGVDYTLLAKYRIYMEQSDDCPHNLGNPPAPPPGKACMNITGNVAVSDPNNPANTNDGRLQIGAKNDIQGEAIADEILFGSFSQSDSCKFNSSVPAPTVGANGQCIAPPVPAPPLPLVSWPPLGPVPVNNCADLTATPSITVPSGETQTLVPGCYRNVLVGVGGTLNLNAGSYIFKTLTLKAGSALNGNMATVNVQGATNSEGGVKLNDVTIETPGTVAQTVREFIVIGKGNELTNVLLYAPTAAIHLHTGTTGTGVAAVANVLAVDPVILKRTVDHVPPPVVADCNDQLIEEFDFTGTQYHDCFTGLLRASELQVGEDQGLECPGSPPYGDFPYACGPPLPSFPSVFVATSQSNKTWLSQLNAADDATGEWCIDGLDVVANGTESWGPIARLVTTPTTASFIAAMVSEGKGTDTMSVLKGEVTNLATEAITWTTLTTTNLNGAIQAYGGANANGRCCQKEPGPGCWNGTSYLRDNACHANLWWVSVCLKIENLADGQERYTATVGTRGSGGPTDSSRASPYSAIGAAYTAVYTGPRPSDIAATGKKGFVLRTIQGVPTTSVTRLRLGPM